MVAHDIWDVGEPFESDTLNFVHITQLGECLPYKQDVGGSSPSMDTGKEKEGMINENWFLCRKF